MTVSFKWLVLPLLLIRVILHGMPNTMITCIEYNDM
jgi:hypothetical protein